MLRSIRREADRGAVDLCKILFVSLHEPCGRLLFLVVFGVPRSGKTGKNAECTNTTILQFVSPLEASRNERERQVLLAHSTFWKSQIDTPVDRNSIGQIFRYGWKRLPGSSQICLRSLDRQGRLKLEKQSPPR
jgi:hypothetical protein